MDALLIVNVPQVDTPQVLVNEPVPVICPVSVVVLPATAMVFDEPDNEPPVKLMLFDKLIPVLVFILATVLVAALLLKLIGLLLVNELRNDISSTAVDEALGVMAIVPLAPKPAAPNACAELAKSVPLVIVVPLV